jgi:hypothetical protein
MTDEVIYPVGWVSPVPPKVTSRQAKEAMIRRGIIGQVQPVINALDDGTPLGAIKKAIAQNAFDNSQDFIRDWPILMEVATAMGIDGAGLDELFIFALGL